MINIGKKALKYNDLPKSLKQGKAAFIIIMIAVPVINYIVFYIVQNFNSLLLAFQELRGLDENNNKIFIYSLNNYKQVFGAYKKIDSDLFISLRNTLLLFTVDMLMIVPVFILAYSFSKNLRGAKFFRLALYLPSIISGVVIVTMVKNILSPDGPINEIIHSINGKGIPPLLFQNSTAFTTILAYCIWAGFYQNLLLLEGSIRRIPSETIDAALIDGVNARQELIYITIPMLWETVSTLLVLQIAGIFTIGSPVLLFTNGAYNTTTFDFWFFSQVKYNDSYNVTAAAGIVLTLITLPLVFFARKILIKPDNSVEY